MSKQKTQDGRVNKMKVSLFITCISEMFYQNVAKDVVEVQKDRSAVASLPITADTGKMPKKRRSK